MAPVISTITKIEGLQVYINGERVPLAVTVLNDDLWEVTLQQMTFRVLLSELRAGVALVSPPVPAPLTAETLPG